VKLSWGTGKGIRVRVCDVGLLSIVRRNATKGAANRQSTGVIGQ